MHSILFFVTSKIFAPICHPFITKESSDPSESSHITSDLLLSFLLSYILHLSASVLRNILTALPFVSSSLPAFCHFPILSNPFQFILKLIIIILQMCLRSTAAETLHRLNDLEQSLRVTTTTNSIASTTTTTSSPSMLTVGAISSPSSRMLQLTLSSGDFFFVSN